MTACPYKIRVGTIPSTTVQCRKEAHVPPDMPVEAMGSDEYTHEALASNGITRITWFASDRREFTGDWPGYCTKIDGPPFMGGCVLPARHHGRCAT